MFVTAGQKKELTLVKLRIIQERNQTEERVLSIEPYDRKIVFPWIQRVNGQMRVSKKVQPRHRETGKDAGKRICPSAPLLKSEKSEKKERP